MKSILTSLFSLVLCATLHAQIPSYVPTDGLVGWWPFNGNANDESGNGNHGVVNGAILTTDRLGNTNAAYSFDGTSARIALGNVLPNIGAANSAVTISLWFKTDTAYTPGPYNYPSESTLISDYKRQGPCCELNYLCEIRISESPYGLYWNMRGSGADNNYSKDGDFTDNVWHNLVLQVDGIGSEKMYLDGQFIAFTDFNGQPFSGQGTYNADNNYANQTSPWVPDWQLGAAHWNDGSYASDYINFFKGTLDDIAIYNRALTPAEITQLYTATEEPVAECNLIASETQDTPVEVGGSAQMYVTLSATDFSMQWQTNAAGLGWMDVQDNNTYTGSQTQNLLISNATLANHEQPFRIIVTDGICNDTSDVAMLLVNNTCTAYDTITNVVEVFDTLTIENVVDVFDTITVFNTVEVFDTLTVYNTVDVFDTTEFVVETFDTLTNVIDVFDTTTVYLQVDIFDTLFIDVYDTTYVTLTDTTYIQVIDTAYVTVTDTLLIDITFVGFEGQPSWLNTVLVYPNPTSDHITIDYGNFALMAGYNTIITDAAGATVYSSAVNAQQAYIDINAWGAAGVYYLSVYDVNGAVVAVRQIVLE